MRAITLSLVALVLALSAEPPTLESAGKQFRYRYNAAASLPKPFFHPVELIVGDKALRFTRSFPMEKDVPGETKDHGHHRGIWFCHGDVIADGYAPPIKLPTVAGIDFWTEGAGRGRIVCTKAAAGGSASDDGCTVGWDDTTNEWRGPDGTVLLRERRRILRRILMDDASPRLLWLDSILAAAERAVAFGDTKEGAFAVRVNDHFCEKNGGLIRNAKGKQNEKDCWGQQADWCDYSGKVDGQPLGIAIFDHPDNRARACWHVRAYGLMAANPFGRQKSGFPAMKDRTDLVALKPGESLRLRYGVLLYSGSLTAGEIQKEFDRFVELARKPNQ
jgi:hypothetical protein